MYELKLSDDANLSPYIGHQLLDAGFWNHQNNMVHTVRDSNAQTWADSFDWLTDSKKRCKDEILKKVHEILELTPEQVIRHRTYIQSENDKTYYLIDNGQYIQKTGQEVSDLLKSHQQYEQNVHQFAHDLIIKLNTVTNMQELRNVREIEGDITNWPKE